MEMKTASKIVLDALEVHINNVTNSMHGKPELVEYAIELAKTIGRLSQALDYSIFFEERSEQEGWGSGGKDISPEEYIDNITR